MSFSKYKTTLNYKTHFNVSIDSRNLELPKNASVLLVASAESRFLAVIPGGTAQKLYKPGKQAINSNGKANRTRIAGRRFLRY